MIFRRTDKFGYSRYYGGGGPAFVIKIVVSIALMLALVIGAAAFVMQKYMVYTENGGHLELPWEKKVSQPAEDPGGLEGLVIDDGEESAPAEESSLRGEEDASQNAEGSASAEASQSAEGSASAEASQSAEGSASAEASQSAEGSVSTEASQSAEESVGAEASQSGDASVEPGPARPGLWERVVNWLKSLFRAPQSTVGDQSTRVEETESSAEPEKDPADGFWPILPGKEKEESASGAESSAEKSEPEPEKKEPLSGGLLLQHVSIGDVKGGYAEGDIKNKKGNGIMLFMKESGGKLNFVSDQSLAGELEVNTDQSSSDQVKDVISQLKSQNYYTLAYLNCFQDQKAGPRSEYGLYDEGGAAWYDGEDRAWADPANQEYQDYLIGLIGELEDMGFDEIVLTNSGYPSTGDTSILSGECYDPDTFEKTVSAFYERVAEKYKDSKSMISILTTEKAVREGYDETTGQSLEAMLQLGGRLWVDTDREEAAGLSEALSKAGYPDNALGVVVSSLDAEESVNQLNPD